MFPGYLLQTERETLKFKLLAVLVVTAGVYLRQSTVPWLPAVILVLLYTGYAVALRYVLIPRYSSPLLVVGMVVVDEAVITTALYLSGSIESVIFILFPVSIIYYAFHLAYVSSLLAATLASLGYIGVATITHRLSDVLPVMTSQIPLFYLLAIFSGYVATGKIKERAEKLAFQEALNVEMGAKGLLEVARALHRTLDVGTVLQEMARASPALVDLPVCVVALLDTKNGCLVGHTSNLSPKELGVEVIEDITEPLAEGSPVARALDSGEPIAVDSDRDDHQRLSPWAQRLGVGQLLVVPLVRGEENEGVMYLFRLGPGPQLTEVQMRLARGLEDLASTALQNAELYRAAQEKVGKLLLELEAAIQRIGKLRQPGQKAVLSLHDLKIDPFKRQVVQGGHPVTLSPTEFDALYFLADNAGRAFSKETIYRSVWSGEYRDNTNIVDVTLFRLRKRLEGGAPSPRYILSVRGVGYMFAAEDQVASV